MAASITRTSEKPGFLSVKPVSHDFQWFLSSIWQKGSAQRARINILDTVTCSKGNLTAWLFTASDGTVKRKAAKNLSPKTMLQTFANRALSFVRNSSGFVATNYSSGTSPIQLLDSNDLEKLFKTGNASGIFQCFVMPKGVAATQRTFENYRVEYSMHDNGKPIINACKSNVFLRQLLHAESRKT